MPHILPFPASRLLPSLLAFPALLSSCAGPALAPPPPSRTFEFSMKAVLPAGPGLRGPVTLWLPAPVEEDAQELGPLRTFARGGEIREGADDLGNRFLSIRGTPEPGKPLLLGYRVRVRRYEVRKHRGGEESGSQPKVDRWLAAPRLAPVERVKREALFATAGATSTLAKARILYDKVVSEVAYEKPPGEGWGRGSLDWVCTNKYGNCSDFHTLFIAYNQSIGTPARFEIGFPLPPETSFAWKEIRGYHCWACFFVPGFGWVPVDASEARKHPERKEFFFGGLTKDRIRLTRGRDLVLDPPQSGPPLNFFVYPYAECGGKDVSDRVRREILFRDLGPPVGRKD